jgi:hypothetical protein
MAAMNPFGEDYDVEKLDPALMSRFMVLHVVADAKEWCLWAGNNGIHPVCVEYAKQNPSAIQDATLSPRTLHYISNFIKDSGAVGETLLAGLYGLSEKHGPKIFAKLNIGYVEQPVSEMFKSPIPLVAEIKKWIASNRTDLLDKISTELLRSLKGKPLPKTGVKKMNFEKILQALPSEKQTEIRKFVAECQPA